MAQPEEPRTDIYVFVSALVVTIAATIIVLYDSLGLSRTPMPDLVAHLRATGAVLWVTWGVLRSRTLVGRKLVRLEKIVGQRFEEGYAQGYVDGAARTAPTTERPLGTVYSINGDRPARHR